MLSFPNSTGKNMLSIFAPSNISMGIRACVLGMSLLATGCGTLGYTHRTVPAVAGVVNTGTVACFSADLLATKKPPTCELSAVAKREDSLVFANDKPIPGDANSPVFSMAFSNPAVSGDRRPFTAPYFREATKYEGMTVTPDGKWVIATTAFDRFNEGKNDLDGYNRVLAWPAGRPEQVEAVIGKTHEDSVLFRGRMLRLLQAGEPAEIKYFKIEGLAALPDKLLFGVREMGKDHENFQYARKLVEVGYSIDPTGKLVIGDDLKLNYQFTVSEPGVPADVGLSSVEYDRDNGRLYLLTSYERDQDIGAYLWVLPITDDSLAGNPPVLVKTAQGKPLHFAHKAEGLAILDQSRVLVIHDDDRITEVNESGTLRKRPLNESVYEIVQFE
jgi:hypothetical protein